MHLTKEKSCKDLTHSYQWSSCGLPENIRGERLSISDFAALSKALRRAEG